MTGPRRFLRWLVLGLFVAVIVTAGLFACQHLTRSNDAPPTTEGTLTPDPPTPDPRLVYATPFRNVKPDVKYVGDAACEGCHRSVCKSYHAHPMGRSAELLAQSPLKEKLPAKGPAAFTSGPFDFEVEASGEGMTHRVRLREGANATHPEAVIPVQVAIGSGTRGRSYLTTEGGRVWQSPVSWFGPEERWDISPGYRIGRTLQRPIGSACLYCHVDHVEPVAGSLNRFHEPLFAHQVAIGCERCHGPGGLHAAERADKLNMGIPDTSIVNPKHLSATLQLAVCEQCHLQGQERVNRRGRNPFEYRPGLPYDRFVSVYVRHPDLAESNKSVGQFEQMEQSHCFQKSGGKLTCTSCHDPHTAPTPAEKDVHYRRQCLTCHQPPGATGCSAPAPAREAKADSCVACHMPKAASSNITHASVTNHRIVRTPTPPAVARPLPFDTVPLVRFRPGGSLPAEELERDLGIALARFARLVPSNDVAARGDPRGAAVGRLKESLARWPGDAEAWAALSAARSERGEAAEKLKAAKNAFRLAPQDESAVTTLSEVATVAGEFDLALEMAEQGVAMSPRSADPLITRGFIRLKQGEWAGAEADCLAALNLHPLHAEAHLYLAICRHQQGDVSGGAKAAQTAAALETDPRESAALTDWYRRATR
jgi:hypothetical protein